MGLLDDFIEAERVEREQRLAEVKKLMQEIEKEAKYSAERIITNPFRQKLLQRGEMYIYPKDSFNPSKVNDLFG